MPACTSTLIAERECSLYRDRGARSEGRELLLYGLHSKPNGYVLEQVFSQLVVQTSPEHDELRAIARQCITRRHVKHYLGFTESQWQLFTSERPRRVKPLLYVFRVLLTGIHLLRTGEVQANLPALNAEFHLPYIDDLIALKLAGPEHALLEDADLPFYEGERTRLLGVLQASFEASPLPDSSTATAALNDLLIRVRLREEAVYE